MFSRGKPVGTVQDMVISELYGKRFVFVLHLDGTLRIWDLASHSRVFNHTMTGIFYFSDLIPTYIPLYLYHTCSFRWEWGDS